MNKKYKIVVGMSGGVDSSVTAALLKEQGHEVIGMFMKNWEEKDENGVCTSAEDYKDVEKVCVKLDIPYYSIDFVKEYWDNVFVHFLKEYEMGYTPNPDILCNREIKFKVFFDKAMKLGADFLATGHYAQTENGKLLKAVDNNKDQTYFLYAVKEDVLKKVLFPVGNLPKSEVRRIAKKYDLATAEKKDSTGICFIGERNFRQFLANYLKEKPGKFVTPEGRVVGKHKGAVFYTEGQRKGLGIGGMKDSTGESWFVVSKNVKENTVTVVQGDKHPALYADELTATEISWVGEGPTHFPYHCKAKIRYRQMDQDCTITKVEGDRLWVTFSEPQRAITIRQSIVFYAENICLGGAMIESHRPTYFEMKKPLPQIVSVQV
jgi:tRNA-specific 2-thiouridylase